jgi:hypothetical protein
MGDVVNLRLVRKRSERQRKANEADQQRVLHGLKKTERSLSRVRQDKARRDLEQHRIEPGDGQ